MNRGSTIFSQVLDFLPKQKSRRCVDRYSGINYPSGFAFGYAPTRRCHKKKFLGFDWTRGVLETQHNALNPMGD